MRNSRARHLVLVLFQSFFIALDLSCNFAVLHAKTKVSWRRIELATVRAIHNMLTRTLRFAASFDTKN